MLLFTLFTLLAWGVNLASGLIQARFSEALCVLPFFTFDAVLGLFIGCLLANTITGAFIYDIIFGSMATRLPPVFVYVEQKPLRRSTERLLNGLLLACGSGKRICGGWLLNMFTDCL